MTDDTREVTDFQNGDLVNSAEKFFDILRDFKDDNEKTFFVFATVKTGWCPPCRTLTKVLFGDSKFKEEVVWSINSLDKSGFWNNFIKDSPNIIKNCITEIVNIFLDPIKSKELTKQRHGELLEKNKDHFNKIFKKMVDREILINDLTKIVLEKLVIMGIIVDGDNENEIELFARYNIHIRGYPTTITFLSSVDYDFIGQNQIGGPDIKNFYIKNLEAVALFILITYTM